MNTKLFFISCMAVLVMASCQKANSYVDRTVETNTGSGISGEVFGIWEKGSVKNIGGDIIVPEGKSLLIEEGVTVIMDSVKKPEFIVKGNLYCMGTQQNPVLITGPAETRNRPWGQVWGGILATPACGEMLFDNTIIELGGATTTEASTSVKMGLYKAVAGENLPAIWFSNTKGKLVINNSTVRFFHDDATYIEGGKLLVTGCKFYTTGNKGGEAVNIKSGVEADVSYNLFYSNNTNALKLSNSGDRTPQAHVVAFNNTILNTGWRRPDIKGGSVWLEATVYAEIFNNLFVNTRFGIKQDAKKLPDSRSKYANNFYYGFTKDAVTGFTPNGKDILAGTNDIIDTKTPGANDPLLVNYPLDTDVMNYNFNTGWDFHLKPNSPALGKGTQSIKRIHTDGITINNINYPSPAPATYIGAYGIK